MKKLYYIIPSGVLMMAIVFFTANDAMTSSQSAPFGNTGSLGDGSNNTCAKGGCHVGTVNSGTGTIDIDLTDIPMAGWGPGQTYDITVNVAQAGIGTFGFQLTVENPVGAKKGTLTGNNGVNVTNTNWVTHKNTSGTGSWTFQWTAPSDNSETLTFYAVGNAANGNGGTTGDRIYTTNKSVDRDPIAGIEDYLLANQISILSNPVSEIMRIEAPEGVNLFLYNMSGQLLRQFQSTSGITEVSVNGLNSGMYLLASENGAFADRILIK